MPRRLGQHFLRPASVQRLIQTIDPRPDERFLEIGAGAGALTLPLAARVAHLTTVEIDAALVERLRPRLPPNVTLVHADALTVDLAALAEPDTRVAGNLPYYISSPLVRRLLELHARVRDAHLMLQDEVARRIASPPGSKEYGILSILSAVWADVDVPLEFPPGCFEPPPKVDSAVLRLRFREHPKADVPDMGVLEHLLHKAFGRRRRTLENNLRDSYANLKESLRLLNIEGSRRPETLSVVEFAALAGVLRPR